MKFKVYLWILTLGIITFLSCNRKLNSYIKDTRKYKRYNRHNAEICMSDMPLYLQNKCKNPFSDSKCYSLIVFWNECLVNEVFIGREEAIDFSVELIELLPSEVLAELNIKLLRGQKLFNALIHRISMVEYDEVVGWAHEFDLYDKTIYMIDSIDGRHPWKYFEYPGHSFDFSEVDRNQDIFSIRHEEGMIVLRHAIENNLLKLKNYGQH